MRSALTFTLSVLALTALAGPAQAAPPPSPPDGDFFERQVRPVLSRRCFSCHAGKVQLSGLRLDSREAVLKGGKSGPAVVPGKPAASALVKAVRYSGALKMPPAGKLPEAEIAVLERWIEMGAPWERMKAEGGRMKTGPSKLWALEPVRKPALPVTKLKGWARNPVDAFILAELEKQGLKPSPSADRRTLIRRVSLDLTGLPPTPYEVDTFLRECEAEQKGSPNPQSAIRNPQSYERLVDRLLASPAYGERMALPWLDLGRYADSDGYHDDTDRTQWAYRDYVINAFNRNKPFDQFTVEQIAGDLLPNATLEQKVASAFHRNGPTTSEGGAIPEEVMARYASDRVGTTANVWLGLSIQCAECHDHKYDPLTARDFYSLSAFFNQVPEEALYRGADAPPSIPMPTPGQQVKLDELAREIEKFEGQLKACAPDGAQAAELKKKLDEVKKARTAVEKLSRLRIMADVPERRPTHVLLRGDYRSKGPEVQPAVPAVLGTLPAPEKANRLALAKWLVDPKQPLTARVTVNRFWQTIFGTGIVATSDDFGTRGEPPTHPELLDWLAHEFVRSGWDVKHMVRLIVTSATYQQSSAIRHPTTQIRDLQSIDPENRLLARGARFRLPAELIRDNALAISGLLDRERPAGGPSVKPYQPGDLWRELSSGDQAEKSYVQDKGPDLYRRGLYTFWKRSVLYPSFAVFDAPKREVCVARRLRTNTPLAAFTALNDPTYVEAARVFAQRILKHGGVSFDTRLTYAYRAALGRLPSSKDRGVLGRIYTETLAHYTADRAAAAKLVSTGESPRPPDLDVPEHAAWTCVCNTILNLDEVITRE